MRCPTCGSSSVLHDHFRGEIICTRCGLVLLERLLDPGPEWRRGKTEETGRADVGLGSDVTQHDLGLGTTFRVSAELSPGLRASIRRMGRLQSRSRVSSWRDRSLREVLVDLDRMCEMLGIPRGLKAEVSVMYRKLMSRGFTMGRDHITVLAALLFLVCRMRGLPRRCEEISGAAGAGFGKEKACTPRAVRRLVKLISREMNLKLRAIGPEEYLERFADQLGLGGSIVAAARGLLREMPEGARMGKSPVLLAAISIYLSAGACGEKLTLRRISSVTGVGVSTLSKNISLLRAA
jgi:transcription initiation factor TFIIB